MKISHQRSIPAIRFEVAPYSRRVSVEINLKALIHNFQCVRACRPSTKIFSVLKADAYGHGAVPCARILSESGSDGFAVVFPAEAEALRDAGIKEPILVLQGPANDKEVQQFTAQNLWPVIHDISQLALLANRGSSKLLKIWIKVETGMGRLGLDHSRLPELLAKVTQLPNVQCLGVLSHLACADQTENRHTQLQIETFTQLQTTSVQHLAWSLSNSAGVLAWPQASFDWVRPGIMLYGSNPLVERSNAVPLLPAMQVSAPLIALKSCRRGEGIGYSQSYNCPEDMMVGHVAIGYGDGLPRAVSGASVLLRGVTVPIIGRVSMDSIALDLRGVDSSVGDEVIIWGRDNPVDNMAKVASTISYELLCTVRGNRHYKY